MDRGDSLGLLDHVRQVMFIQGTIGDGGQVHAPARRRGEGERIISQYHPDDGHHAFRLVTGDFDPLYKDGAYMIFTTGTLRDAVVNRPALVRTIGDGGAFGFVERVTMDAVHFKASLPGRAPAVVRRDEVEMVYIPIDHLFTT